MARAEEKPALDTAIELIARKILYGSDLSHPIIQRFIKKIVKYPIVTNPRKGLN
jgi:predicted TIM-barrel fold metal-dependent hydrolase